MRPLYLDYNATTPVHPDVVKAMEPYWTEEFGNPSSRTHIYGQRANEAVEKARKQIATVVDCDPSEVIFTSGATESNNLAILGLARHPTNADKKHIISSPIEHKSVLEPLNHLKECGYDIELVNMDKSGRVNTEDVLSRIRKDTLLVSIMHVNNETGIIQPIDEIAHGLSGSEVYFHVDAAQSFTKIFGTLQNNRIDFISASAHKISGPKGIGTLIRRKRDCYTTKIVPLFFGGEQERGARPGTVPTPLTVGFGKAAEIMVNSFQSNQNKFSTTLDKIISMLPRGLHIIGDNNTRIGSTMGIILDNITSESFMLTHIDMLSVSNGSACSSSSYNNSYVLKAMGYSDTDSSKFIRISIGC